MGLLVRLAVIGGLAYGVKKYLDSNPDTQRAVRQAGERAKGQARHAAGQLRGQVYRMRGGHPDTDVDEGTLADRVRSTLGPLEKRLDLPRVHVTAEGSVIKLHGDVPSADDARQIEKATEAVAGVTRVESHLTVGLARGTSRPSEGREAPSGSPNGSTSTADTRGATG